MIEERTDTERAYTRQIAKFGTKVTVRSSPTSRLSKNSTSAKMDFFVF
jgi:hypothetical protein